MLKLQLQKRFSRRSIDVHEDTIRSSAILAGAPEVANQTVTKIETNQVAIRGTATRGGANPAAALVLPAA